MKTSRQTTLEDRWTQHDAQWRNPQQVVGHWQEADNAPAGLFHHRVTGDWWGLLDDLALTLVVSREYEHLLMALSAPGGQPRVSYLSLPHPSGLAADRKTKTLFVACTRNPNQILELTPASGCFVRTDESMPDLSAKPLMPVGAAFFAGSLYLHDLALIGGQLHGNAVGHNAVVRFENGATPRHVWWPKCIEKKGKPDFSANFLQLNGMAAGRDLASSFFTASTEAPSPKRPGDLDWPVDKRGVVFAGESREPVCRGLTRPHSPRLHRGRLWLDNSGYGELVVKRAGGYEVLARLPGWTRGLALVGDVAFVGVSRVISRYAVYAPGLNVEKSRCGVFAVCLKTGKVLASLAWPQGNQIFAIEIIPRAVSTGFPRAVAQKKSRDAEKNLYYAYQTNSRGSSE